MDAVLRKEYETRMFNARLEASKRGFSALLVFGLAPRRVGDLMYLTGHQPLLPGHPRRFGFRGRGYSVIVLPVNSDPCLITSTPFYEKDLYIDEVIYEDNLPEAIGAAIRKRELDKADIGIVGMDILGVALFDDLKAELGSVKFYHADDIVMNLRAAKSAYEISLLRKGAEIGDEVATLLRDFLHPGLTERDVLAFISSELTKRGVTGATGTCQSGIRSEDAYNLVPASDKVLENGDMVHMEINGKYAGYMIDICRSTVIGKASEKQIYLLDTALEMFHLGCKAMKPGVSAEHIEKVCGDYAVSRGFDKNATKAYGGPATLMGHAIGFGVDEPPVLAKYDITPLVAGMVITLEPGLYRTGYGGCRVEDEVLVTADGIEDLNHSDLKWW